MILTLAITYKWDIQQLDVNNAFLNGTLNDEVCMIQPPRFSCSDTILVCKLYKAIYGFKQPLRVWYEKLTQAMLQFGFKQGISLYVLVYVDDILITGSCSSLVQYLINKLYTKFSLKRLGKPSYFLGIKVKHLKYGSLLLTQCK